MTYGIIGLAIGVALLIGLAAGQSTLQGRIDRAERRLATVERKLDAVLEHLGVSLPEPRYPQVAAFLAEGRKIQAIKAYREATGADLRTAKDDVERMAAG